MIYMTIAERHSQIPRTIGHMIYMTIAERHSQIPRTIGHMIYMTIAERHSQIPRTIDHMIYMTMRKDIQRYPGPLVTWSTWLCGKIFKDTQDHWSHDLHDYSGKTFTDTQDHWSHDLHDYAERHSKIPRTIGHMIYMTMPKDIQRYPGPLVTWSTWLCGKTFTDTQDHWSHDLHDYAERHSKIPRTICRMIYMTMRKDIHRYPGPLATWATWLSRKTFTDAQDRWSHDLHD